MPRCSALFALLCGYRVRDSCDERIVAEMAHAQRRCDRCSQRSGIWFWIGDIVMALTRHGLRSWPAAFAGPVAEAASETSLFCSAKVYNLTQIERFIRADVRCEAFGQIRA
jgi:hypothetical protein